MVVLIQALLGGAALPSANTEVAAWVDNVTYGSFFVWGTALGAAAIYHYQRTRGRCPICGRG